MKRNSTKRGAKRPSKRYIPGRAGKMAIKGPMARQHLEGMRPDEGTRTKDRTRGRDGWPEVAQ